MINIAIVILRVSDLEIIPWHELASIWSHHDEDEEVDRLLLIYGQDPEDEKEDQGAVILDCKFLNEAYFQLFLLWCRSQL